jgi:uncharacterized protein (TIGR02996 family)
VYWEATDVEVVSGAIGSNGRAKQYDFASHLDCKQFVEREILKRTKDGFEEVVPEVVQSQKAPRAEPPPALLARIVEAPDDDQPRMVYADWLQQQGDPLGELIAVQLEIARAESPPKSLRDREDNLLGNYRARWLPGIVGLDVTFVRGFVDTVKVELPFERAMLDRVVEVAPLIRTAPVGARVAGGAAAIQRDLDGWVRASRRRRRGAGRTRSAEARAPRHARDATDAVAAEAAARSLVGRARLAREQPRHARSRHDPRR